ncbi:MAG: glycosyltransferase family 2 protein [Candidatus Woesearchaeota archaeon]
MNIVYYLTLVVIFISLFLGFVWLFYLISLELQERKREVPLKPITIVVPAYNEENTIYRTLSSIFSLDYDLDKLRVFVVNDGSRDRTKQKILEFIKKHPKFRKNLKVIHKESNEGKAKALNDALKNTNTFFFACVDADSVLERNSLKNNIKYFFDESGKLKKHIGAVISVVKVKNPYGLLGFAQNIEYLIMALYRKLFAYANFLNVTPGVLSVYRTEVLKEVNGFDETSITEDFEVAMKIVKRHYKIEMSTESVVYTDVPLNFKSWWKQRLRWYRGFIETMIKHRDLIFSREHGAFGLFYIPVTVVAPFVLFLAISLILYKMFQEMRRFIFKLIFAPQTIKWFSIQTLEEFIFDTNYFITIPLIVLFLIFLYTIIKSLFFSDESFNIKTFIGCLIYLYLYPYFTFAQWIHATILLLKKKQKSW